MESKSWHQTLQLPGASGGEISPHGKSFNWLFPTPFSKYRDFCNTGQEFLYVKTQKIVYCRTDLHSMGAQSEMMKMDHSLNFLWRRQNHILVLVLVYFQNMLSFLTTDTSQVSQSTQKTQRTQKRFCFYWQKYAGMPRHQPTAVQCFLSCWSLYPGKQAHSQEDGLKEEHIWLQPPLSGEVQP